MAAAPDVTTPDDICSSPGDPRVDSFHRDPTVVVMEWTEDVKGPQSLREDVDLTGYSPEEIRSHTIRYNAWMKDLQKHLSDGRYVVVRGWKPDATTTWDVNSISRFKGAMEQSVEFQGEREILVYELYSCLYLFI
jgi:hypothetical protein